MSRLFAFVLLCLFSFSARAQGFTTDVGDIKSVTVLASSSLSQVMTELIRLYSVNRDSTVNVSFGTPQALLATIAAGEPGDIFIAEDPRAFEELKRQGQADVYSLTNLAENRLVLAVPNSSNWASKIPVEADLKTQIQSITTRTFLVISKAGTAPLSDYTQDALAHLGDMPATRTMTMQEDDPERINFLIAEGNVGGITYATALANQPALRKVADIPGDWHAPIVYQGIVVAGENMQLARDFLEFLKSKPAQVVFEKYGFLLS